MISSGNVWSSNCLHWLLNQLILNPEVTSNCCRLETVGNGEFKPNTLTVPGLQFPNFCTQPAAPTCCLANIGNIWLEPWFIALAELFSCLFSSFVVDMCPKKLFSFVLVILSFVVLVIWCCYFVIFEPKGQPHVFSQKSHWQGDVQLPNLDVEWSRALEPQNGGLLWMWVACFLEGYYKNNNINNHVLTDSGGLGCHHKSIRQVIW